MGSPFGLTHSVSHGIISARGRHEQELRDDGVENQDFLQTDAAINPGNSGGPLVDMKGQVVGINTAIASNHGGSEGVGFSIPINLAKWSMRQLLSKGKVNRGAMGVDLNEVSPDVAITLGLERPAGARVTAVHPDSPASAAGMQADDVVIRFNGTLVSDLDHLINLVSMAPIGEPAVVVVWRGREPVDLSVVVADRDAVLAKADDRKIASGAGGIQRRSRPSAPEAPESNPESSKLALGLEIQTLDQGWIRKLGLPDASRGAAIVKVDPNSPLARHFKSFDVIETIDGRQVKSADEVVRALSNKNAVQSREIVLLRRSGDVVERTTIRVP